MDCLRYAAEEKITPHFSASYPLDKVSKLTSLYFGTYYIEKEYFWNELDVELATCKLLKWKRLLFKLWKESKIILTTIIAIIHDNKCFFALNLFNKYLTLKGDLCKMIWTFYRSIFYHQSIKIYNMQPNWYVKMLPIELLNQWDFQSQISSLECTVYTYLNFSV